MSTVSTHMVRCKGAQHPGAKSGFLCESRTDPKYGECLCIVWVVCILLCDCVMQRLLDFLGPMPLEHPMKAHDPAARCSSYPIPEGPRVPWRPLGITGKGAYPNVNRIVNMTDIFLSFSFLQGFSIFYNERVFLNNFIYI